jgi:hypothetical protein
MNRNLQTREMKMKKQLFLTLMTVAICLVLGPMTTHGQSTDIPKYEVAGDFTSLSLNSGTTLPGFGGRFTYNINKHLALEAAGYFFPGKCDSCTGEVTGHIGEGLFGVKAGKRFEKWGIFAKARPGFVTFGKGAFNITPAPVPAAGVGFPVQCLGPDPLSPGPCFTFQSTRLTHAALDIGGVLEFYPTRRLVVRFDAGDTMIRYGQRTFNTLIQNPATGAITLVPITGSAHTRHSFQFMGGVGFRF